MALLATVLLIATASASAPPGAQYISAFEGAQPPKHAASLPVLVDEHDAAEFQLVSASPVNVADMRHSMPDAALMHRLAVHDQVSAWITAGRPEDEPLLRPVFNTGPALNCQRHGRMPAPPGAAPMAA